MGEMMKAMAERWREREQSFERFARWTPPPSPRELATRLRWLDEVLGLARRSGNLPERAVDSPEIRSHRQKIRRALARVRV